MKPGLSVVVVQSYRPISNIPVVSKLLERIVLMQVNLCLQYSSISHSLFILVSDLVIHLVVTAVLRVVSDLLCAVDGGDVTALALLDLFASFDMHC